MSSEGLMSSAKGLVPSASSSPILYVSFGERELLGFPYNRTHNLHLAVSMVKNKLEIEKKNLEIEKEELKIEELEEEVAEYRRKKSQTTNNKGIKRLEDLIGRDIDSIRQLRDSIRQLRDLIIHLQQITPYLDNGLLQMDICSQSKGRLSWSSPLEDDVIEEAQNCETPLAVTERSKLCRRMWQTQVENEQ